MKCGGIIDYKKWAAKGFGALADCPNKKNAKHRTPVAIHLLERSEVYKQIKK
jgi:hypothetical protein